MSNEILYLALAAIDLCAVLVAFRVGKSCLYTIMAANIFLISLFGAKLITLGGFVTNAGNVFFACIFFAAHLLTEHYGTRDAQRAVWMSYAFQVLFLVNMDLVLKLTGTPGSATVDGAFLVLFEAVPRIILASFVAYLFSLYTTIGVYDAIRTATHGKMLLLRDTVANIVGQGVDSVLFFAIAFYGTMTSGMLYETMAVGFAVKVLIGVLGTPLLYLSFRLKPASQTLPGETSR